MTRVIIAADIHDDWNDETHFVQEWESRDSVEKIRDVIIQNGMQAEIVSPKNLLALVSELDKKCRQNTVVFNLVEGFYSRNRESYVPAIAEFAGIAHSGSDAAAQILTLDKYTSSLLAKAACIPCKEKILVKNPTQLEFLQSFPLFAKPRFEGSGSGIGEWSLLQTREDLSALQPIWQRYGDLIVEEYLPGEEFTTAVLGNEGDYQVLDSARVVFPGAVYGEQIKRKDEMPESLDFDVPQSLKNEMAGYSLQLCDIFGVSGYARIDWKLDANGSLFLLEINLTPGLSANYSTFPLCYTRTRGDYNEMILSILELAREDFDNKRFLYGKMQ